MATTKSFRLFISYSHKDARWIERLHGHLAGMREQKLISGWYDRMIKPGDDWNREIKANLEKADVVLLMVSPDFVGSDYCTNVELKQAMRRHRAGNCRVVPIALHDVDWEGFSFSKLQALPTNRKAVTKWKDKNSGFRDVVRGLRKILTSDGGSKKPSKRGTTDALRVAKNALFLNHTSFLRRDKQKEFQARTGVMAPHYDIRVIVDSFDARLLDKVEKVKYILPEAYPVSTYVKWKRDRSELFQFKELANGEYLIEAEVFLRGRKTPIRLNRYITLWDSGPQLI